MKAAMDDVLQEIRLAELQYGHLSQREMNNAVNRRLHRLARDLGWRRTHPSCPGDIGPQRYVRIHDQFQEWEVGKRI